MKMMNFVVSYIVDISVFNVQETIIHDYGLVTLNTRNNKFVSTK